MTVVPEVTRHVLPSGLTILVETLPYVRSVALGYYLRSGSAVESEEHGGASHFLEHLVFKGTARRSTSDIAQVVDILGGDVDAFTGKEYTAFYAHVLDEQVDTAIDLLTDLLVAPRFTDEDIESERSVILEEIKMVEDTPDDLVHEIFVESFWADHPLGRPILGTEETVNRLQRLPQWQDMAIVIAYDDSDGWYDHVMPPIVRHSNTEEDALTGPGQCGDSLDKMSPGRCGFGPRLPLLILSPWAKENFVDSTLTDQTSILRFIEDNWQVGRIGYGSADEFSGSLLEMFDFSKRRKVRLILDVETGRRVDGE